MHLKCDKETLIENINLALKATSSKTTMPLLECILLTAKDNTFIMTSSDLKIGIETAPIDSNIIEEGSIALNSKMFNDMIRRMPNDIIEIKTDENNIAYLKCGKSEFKMLGLAGDDFPKLPQVQKENSFSLSHFHLKNLIKQTIFASSTDDNRVAYISELFEVKDNVLYVVAVDGFRVAYRKFQLENAYNVSLLIPSDALHELFKTLSNDQEEFVSIYYTDKHVLFEMKAGIIVSRLLEGEFINYEQVFTEEYDTIITVNKDELVMSLERALVVYATGTVNKKTPIKLIINQEKLSLMTQSEVGTIYEELTIEHEGNEMEISFNPKYLYDVLKAIDGEKITIQFMSSLAPGIIKEVGNTDCKYMVLPLRMK